MSGNEKCQCGHGAVAHRIYRDGGCGAGHYVNADTYRLRWQGCACVVFVASHANANTQEEQAE